MPMKHARRLIRQKLSSIQRAEMENSLYRCKTRSRMSRVEKALHLSSITTSPFNRKPEDQHEKRNEKLA